MKERKYLLFREIVSRKDEKKEEDGLAGKKKVRRQRKRKVSTSDTGICLLCFLKLKLNFFT